MANTKYETIVKDLEQYYSPKCPIMLSAYAVLLDTTNNKYGAQLKLTNCFGEQINSVNLTIKAYDHFGNLSEEVKNCQYVNVNASYGNSFGTQTLIPLSKDIPVKNLKVIINNIVFGKGSKWESGDGIILENKLQLHELTSILSKEETETYCFITNSKMEYIPSQEGSFWVCSCGAANYNGQTCNACGADKEKVFLSLDKSTLQDAHNKKEYDDAIELRKEQSVESLEKAITIFDNLKIYKDSFDLATACRDELVLAKKAAEEKRLEEERKEQIRRKELEEKAKKNKKIGLIIAAFAAACLAGFLSVTKIIIPNNNYNAAVKIMEDGDYVAAIEAFEAMGNYKDSTEKIEECKTAIKDMQYNAAVETMENGDYYAAIIAFQALGEYKDSVEKINECHTSIKDEQYNAAVTMMEKGDYIAAYESFDRIADYKDSAEIQKSLMSKYEIALIEKAEIGDTVSFGSYEQDDDETNGQEPIEWVVLKRDENSALLLSRYGIEKMPFSEQHRDVVTWENCSLREWLNDSFLNSAFTEEEQTAIKESNVIAHHNRHYNTDPGEDTQDRVFILSYEEAAEYIINSDISLICYPTNYAERKNNPYHYKVDPIWWLRTPGSSNGYYSVIYPDGKIQSRGLLLSASDILVCPTICVDLSSN